MSGLLCAVEECGKAPEYKHECGMICRGHYRRWRKYGSLGKPIRGKSDWAICTVDGCTEAARTIGGRLCEKHYYRKYRTGDLSDPETGRKWFTSHGYVGTYAPLHPLAGRSGALYLHRVVLHDKIGGGSHPCHWCCEEVEWGGKDDRKLVADHLDNNKENNDPSNLVASCNACNATRGLFMSWVLKHKDDPFLLKLFEAANDNAKSRPSQRFGESIPQTVQDGPVVKAA